mmetsp:Transcript_114571/g.356816  ORF Transcript_114571/g.356816 Transcript_114571/m.356816 type:complete len:256 (-) Transcript_114571:106-873(-)
MCGLLHTLNERGAQHCKVRSIGTQLPHGPENVGRLSGPICKHWELCFHLVDQSYEDRRVDNAVTETIVMYPEPVDRRCHMDLVKKRSADPRPDRAQHIRRGWRHHQFLLEQAWVQAHLHTERSTAHDFHKLVLRHLGHRLAIDCCKLRALQEAMLGSPSSRRCLLDDDLARWVGLDLKAHLVHIGLRHELRDGCWSSTSAHHTTPDGGELPTPGDAPPSGGWAGPDRLCQATLADECQVHDGGGSPKAGRQRRRP